MGYRKQSKEDLKKQLKEQISFIKRSAEAYDKGHTEEAKRIALHVRILVHDTGYSLSLLKQLNILNNTKFVDTSMERIKNDNVKIAWIGLTLIHANKHIPILDDNIKAAKKVNFEKWWSGVVFVDFPGNEVTRKELILFVANQDGGAHIDSKLNETYALLSRENSLGQKYSRNGKTWEDFEGAHLAAIRQIGHEILKTLCPDYTCNIHRQKQGFVFGNIRLYTKPKKSIKSNNHRTKNKN